MVLFGSSAPLIADINLIIQYISFCLLLVGYFKRKVLRTHGSIMLTLTFITTATILVYMGPALVFGLATYDVTILAHAVFGLIVTLLGLLFTTRFILAVNQGRPLSCGTRNMMRLALILWLFPIAGGTFIYLTRYFVL